ncbi:MAG TPA: gephyrin-like molybdotransferase Glp [Candidatus Cybelea sp.]|nr:gephyrin-like molybdotransferase Glp [Candidatus Cybelea sp.]
MTQLADDCFAFGGKLMSAGEALGLLDRRIGTVAEAETVALDEAHGRILAADLIAAQPVPPHENVAVDGYAFAFASLAPSGDSRLKIEGRAAAGKPVSGACGPGTAVRVFTGAVMPAGADTVVMQEDVIVEGDFVQVPHGLKRGANRRKVGEDVPSGGVAAPKGTRLRAQEIGLAAALGQTALQVHRRLRVALFSTGDELREPGEALPPGAIPDSNRAMLRALLAELPVTVSDLGILRDRASEVRDALSAAAATHDLLLTSAGVSTGEEDHVRAAVEALGQLHFWRLAIKPGRPLALGQIGRTPFVGLPGNPVASMVCFLRFCRPILLRMAGAQRIEPVLYAVRADFDHRKRLDRREWLRARLERRDDGALWAKPFPRQGSGILSSLVQSDGLVELGEEVTEVKPGSIVAFLPYTEVGV